LLQVAITGAAQTFFISGSVHLSFFLSWKRTTSPVKLISPTSKPLTPSTVTGRLFQNVGNIVPEKIFTAALIE
jgi:hypothetical protein